MLKKYPQAHLSDDEMLQALVDASDLPTQRRSHFNQCTDCQKEMAYLEQRFDGLGKSARRMAPAPPQPFRLPQKASRQTRWRLTPMWATGMAAAIVLVLVLWMPHQVDRTAHIPPVAQSVPASGDFLLDQVDLLIDDPLPPILQQMAISTDWDDNGSVIDWVVPSVDDIDEDDDNFWT